jgi:hypothetical protein
VRGGNPDQNLLQFDEAIVYNGGHLLGFFSIFNTDVVKDVQVYKGDMPAWTGGRIASLIDIHSRDGNMNQFSGIAGIGPYLKQTNPGGATRKGQIGLPLQRPTHLSGLVSTPGTRPRHSQQPALLLRHKPEI